MNAQSSCVKTNSVSGTPERLEVSNSLTSVILEPVAGSIAGFVTVSPTIDVADGGGSCAKEIAADASSTATNAKRTRLLIGCWGKFFSKRSLFQASKKTNNGRQLFRISPLEAVAKRVLLGWRCRQLPPHHYDRFDWRIGNREAVKSIVSDCRAEFCRAAADEFVVSR